MIVSSISSVAAPPPVQKLEASDPPAPEVKSDGDSDASAAQPVQQAPLPPGQGTRVDQIA